MIKNTNANCKILSTTIYNATATIKCLIYSTQTTPIPQGFRFYFKDLNGDLHKISNNIYWIDRYNSYEHSATHVDTNKYKEIILNIDISNNFTSKLQGTKWIRTGQLVLINQKDTDNKISWASEIFDLISEDFEIPLIKNFSIYSQKDNTIKINLDLSFISQDTFNYSTNNFILTANIYSLQTNQILETIPISNEDIINFKASVTSFNSYTEPVMINICVKNKQFEVLRNYNKLYKPFLKVSSTYIKDKDYNIKQVSTFFVKQEKQKISANYSMRRSTATPEFSTTPVYDINYNNLYVNRLILNNIEYSYVKDNIYINVSNASKFDKVLMDVWIEGEHVESDLDVTQEEGYLIKCDKKTIPINFDVVLRATAIGIEETFELKGLVINELTISEFLTVSEDLTIIDPNDLPEV